MFIKSLSLTYESIHVCTNGCVFFQEGLKTTIICPKCNNNRYMEGSKSIPQKVLSHFPLMSRLIHMYICKSLAELMTWHKNGANVDGLIKSVAYSTTWKHISTTWPNFVDNPFNIRLGLALDEANPFGDLSIRHSTWSMVLLKLIYHHGW